MATGRVPTTANSPLTAKGDLFTYSTAPARLAVGNNGESLVADSSTSTGLRYQGNFAAGKNKLINGGFDNWQRGTSFSVSSSVNLYNADRWRTEGYSATYAVSQQSFSTTTPEVPDSGKFYLRFGVTTAPSGGAIQLTQRIETGNVVSGQTYTLSFYVRAASGTINASAFLYGAITGSLNAAQTSTSPALTTTFQRISKTITLASGYQSSDCAMTLILCEVSSGTTLANVEFANVQLESGVVATSFSRSMGTIQGELAACQRYYQRRSDSGGGYSTLGLYGWNTSSTIALVNIDFSQQMRVTPTSIEYGNSPGIRKLGGTNYSISAMAIATSNSGPFSLAIDVTHAAGTANDYVWLWAAGSTTAYIGWSAEL